MLFFENIGCCEIMFPVRLIPLCRSTETLSSPGPIDHDGIRHKPSFSATRKQSPYCINTNTINSLPPEKTAHKQSHAKSSVRWQGGTRCSRRFDFFEWRSTIFPRQMSWSLYRTLPGQTPEGVDSNKNR